MSKPSLSTVVSGLVRASVGTSISSSITDEDLDKAVADLILKEAKQKAERYLKDGVQAYLPDSEPDANLPRANKRFLKSIIRSTDEHNKAVLRAQAEVAQEAREERMEQERKERRARASEADAERLRRLMGGASRRRDDHNNWVSSRRHRRRSRSRSVERSTGENERNDRSRRSRKGHRSRSKSPRRSDDKGESSSSKRRNRDNDSRDHERRHRKRAASPSSRAPRSSSRSKKRSKHRDEDQDSAHSHRGGRSRSHSSSRSSKKESVNDKPATPASNAETPQLPEDTAGTKDFLDRRREPSYQPEAGPSRPRRKEPASPTLSEEEDIERMRPRRRPRTEKVLSEAGRSSPGAMASKMDKYFESSYDPRLDIEPMTVPTVPSTGLIDGTEFERWEAMLDVIRQRREDKLEKKRLERQGLLPEKTSSKKVVIKGEMASSSAWNGEGASMMDIQYSKKGSVREWDMGKEGF
ncbi:hypothetical protein SCHPADRAFT_884876 [Schizopora paradoxa]|uniref:Uncharacterized protein n=1 Tax=Schizopora paradoxa TaxID=27342 RepID=A0A0H2S743_9AGAM|nr:hypothetical protein SCHPADRAFT_884876 [Schizopora paradoxa]